MPEYDYTLKKENFNLDFFTLKKSAKNKEEKTEAPKKEVKIEAKAESTIAKSTSLHTAKKHVEKTLKEDIKVNEEVDDSDLMSDEKYETEIPGSNLEAEKLALEKYEEQKKIIEEQEEFDIKDFNGEISVKEEVKVPKKDVKVPKNVEIIDPSLKIIESLKSAKTKDIKIDDFFKVIISTFEFLDSNSRAQILCYIIYVKLFTHLMYEGNKKIEKELNKIAKVENFVKTVSTNKGTLNAQVFTLVKQYLIAVSVKGTSLSIFNKTISEFSKIKFGIYVEDLENIDSDLVIPLDSKNFLISVGGRHNCFKTEVISKFLVGTQKIAIQTDADIKKARLLKEKEQKKKAIREVNDNYALSNNYDDYEQYDNEYEY